MYEELRARGIELPVGVFQRANGASRIESMAGDDADDDGEDTDA